MFCHRCGAQTNAGVAFCPNCGERLDVGAGPSVTANPFVPRPGIRAQTGRWISEAWALMQRDMVSFILVGFLLTLLSSVPLLQGPLTVGFHLFCINKMTGRKAEIGDLFNGFHFFIPALVASLLIAVITGFGVMLCIIPGIVAAAALHFTYVFIADKQMDFWPAMQASHAVVKNDYFGFTMFLVTLFLLNVLGLICCLVGLLVTIPLSILAVSVAYRDCVGLETVPRV